METIGRIEALARSARRYRLWIVAVASPLILVSAFWHVTAGLGPATLTVVIVLFYWMPGVETFVRNFVKSYRGQS